MGQFGGGGTEGFKSMAGIAKGLVSVGIILGIGFFVLSTFQTALPAGTGANAVGNVITSFNAGVSTFLTPIVSIAFVIVLFVIAKKSGLI